MQTPAQRCARIVSALEDLAAQEETALRARDFDAASAIADRAAPLVEFLCVNAAVVVSDERIRARLRTVQLRRGKASEGLAAEMESTRAELNQANVTQRRVAQIAPAYGQAPLARPRLSAVG